ncbi:acyl carrier protein [bacterium]|nr:acyl carrier protein [bacterium]
MQIINDMRELKGLRSLEYDGAITLRDDLGLDSLDLAELTVKVEKEYGVDIFESGNVSTLDEVARKLS